MYLVIGNCPRKLELKDLNDSIYYKQQKIYSDVQYNSSNDLKNAERKGLLTVLQRSPDKGGSAELPQVITVANPPISSPPDKSVQELHAKILALEGEIQYRNSIQQIPSSDNTLEQLLDKITRLEQNIQSSGNAPMMSVFFEALKKIEDKITSTQQNDEIFRRLTSLINLAPNVNQVNNYVPGQVKAPEKEEVRPEEVYVPNVVVEDANTHVKLQVRTLEVNSESGVDDALLALKNLKSKSKTK